MRWFVMSCCGGCVIPYPWGTETGDTGERPDSGMVIVETGVTYTTPGGSGTITVTGGSGGGGFDHAGIGTGVACIDCHAADVPTANHFPGMDCAPCHDTKGWY
ncbi:MAG: hypothetical protein ABMB14_25505 [Myxococcota bacterium]